MKDTSCLHLDVLRQENEEHSGKRPSDSFGFCQCVCVCEIQSFSAIVIKVFLIIWS